MSRPAATSSKDAKQPALAAGATTAATPPTTAPHLADPRTRLLSEFHEHYVSDNGTFAPGSCPSSRGSSIRSAAGAGAGVGPGSGAASKRGWMKRAATTAELAEGAGVKHPWLMYLSYYIPCIAWIGHYEWGHLMGDFAAGITMASFYIPMALSLSANLAHLTPIHGLYAFAVQPLVYAFLGSCPTMAVGPEAAGSLLMGNAIRMMNAHHDPLFDDSGDGEGSDFQNARLAATITAMAGAIALAAGVLRLGFLDSVLSRPLLRGFISGVGCVIFVDQLLPEMGLIPLAKEENITHASTLTKLYWLLSHISHTHALTFAIAATSFAVIMVGRVLKQRIAPRHPWIHFLPDRFLVVVLSAILSFYLRWDLHGVEILGAVETGSPPFRFEVPVQIAHLNHAKEAFSTAFLISVLGFFESVVAAKALGTTLDISISSNRELIALGTANILGGCFGALPAFGGYGRSKVNKATGGRTPVSSVVLSVCTILCVLFVLPYFYYLPRCVLCAMISVVGVSLLEEAPHDLAFFARIRAFSDLATMALVFLTTMAWSVSTGVGVGVAISLITVIKHSTLARIQILGRDPLTGVWRAVEDSPTLLEQTPNILVVKIRESLTFANAGDLSRRLWRIDRYGDSHAHPSLPRLRLGVCGVVFDVAGVASIDGSGVQVVQEMVKGYVDRGVGVWFARVSGRDDGPIRARFDAAGIVALCGGPSRFVDTVEEAVRRQDAREAGEISAA